MAVDVLEVSTHDPDAALDTLNSVYGQQQPIRISGDPDGFRCELRIASAGVLGADRVRHTMNARGTVDRRELFVSAMAVHGIVRVKGRAEGIDVGPNTVVRFPLDGYDSAWNDVRLQTVRLPMHVVMRTARERYGVDGDRFRFSGMGAVSPQAAERWRQLIRYLHAELAVPDSALAHPLVQTSFADLLAAVALTVFPNNAALSDHRRAPGYAAPASVRRAVEFADANAARPITLSDLAAAARVTPRALQVAFRRHHGTTPLGYVRRVRLEAARAELAAADPTSGVTVAQVAARHGFGHAARFSEYYREEFGELPSRTLHS